MSDNDAFSIDVNALKSRRKDTSEAATKKADQAGEEHGFISREARGRPGRQPSPRTGQIHAKTLPKYAEWVAGEAARRSVTQGVVLEEALEALWREKGQP